MPIRDSENLQQRVLSIVGRAIADGSLAPGAVLLEAVLADALRTSRTPVRAALGQLDAEKRIQKLDGRGYVVLGREGDRPLMRRKFDRDDALSMVDGRTARRPPAAWSRILGELETEFAGAAIAGPLRIVESEIARLYGVSRTVVRDVLSRFEQAGLVEKDNRRRWRLTPLSLDRALQFVDLRRALEPAALRRAAERGVFEDAASMRERLRDALRRGADVTTFELQRFERELHVDALDRCGNPEIMKALKGAHTQLTSNRRLYQKLDGVRPLIVREHLEIADRLASHDVEGAVEALKAHLGPRLEADIERALDAVRRSAEPPPGYLRAG